jgi:predicted small metal-binding protein
MNEYNIHVKSTDENYKVKAGSLDEAKTRLSKFLKEQKEKKEITNLVVEQITANVVKQLVN